MYAQFFGLKREPFSIAPDPRYLYMSERHREALAHLLYGVDSGGGFVLLTGEIGAGKTTVCRAFLEQVPKKCNVAYIFNPKLTVLELLQSVCEEFGVPAPAHGGAAPTIKDYVDALNGFLLRTHAVGQNSVLIIDEAQNLSADVLEQLRLLTNLETDQRKLLQIVLIGQPELRDMLARPELEQLAQRIIARYHLQALGQKETSHYIAHRMSVAGLDQALPFDRAARLRIHALTGGVPRRINLLCDRALLGAYAGGRNRVDEAIVSKAAVEVFGTDAKPPRERARPRDIAMLGAGVALGAGLLALAGLGLVRSPLSPSGGALTGPAAAASAVGASAPMAVASAGASAADAAASAASVTLAKAAASAPTLAAAKALAPFDAAAALRCAYASEAEAWRALARQWQVELEPGEPCQVAPRQQMQCFRTGDGLAMVRQLDRPGIVALALPGSARPVHALLVGLDGTRATLRLGGATQTLALAELAPLWRGGFATFWRSPAGYLPNPREPFSPATTQWLAAQLARAEGDGTVPDKPVPLAQLKARLTAFQLAQGLRPDGLPGANTFMQLNRVNGVDEPRLQVH